MPRYSVDPARTAFGIIVLVLTGSAAAGDAVHDTVRPRSASLDEASALAVSQASIGRELTDVTLIDHDGRAVRISDWRGAPLIVSMVYTSCYHTCPTLTLHLKRAVEVARDALGSDEFTVLTVGFDIDNDTPDRMRAFAAERGLDTSRWTFASADREVIDSLAADLGFVYVASPRGFDHLAQTTLVDAEGVIRNQIYGDTFEAPLLVEPLKAMVWGQATERSAVSNWVNGVKLFCTVYDPATGRYTFDYSIFIAAIVGALCLGAIAVFIVRSWRHPGPTRKTA